MANYRYDRYWGLMMTTEGQVVGIGYSGDSHHFNQPLYEHLEKQGPLPAGIYTLAAPADDPVVGKYAFKLTPDPRNAMFGRSDFFIHGDNSKANHTASEGCIVMPLVDRMIFHEDDTLTVE
jgi:hypothetical protein